MSKNKNFTINCGKRPERIKAADVRIGDVFEREGSLHMRVNNCMESASECEGRVWICNLNTGSVWAVSDGETWTVVDDCEINYNFKKNQ